MSPDFPSILIEVKEIMCSKVQIQQGSLYVEVAQIGSITRIPKFLCSFGIFIPDKSMCKSHSNLFLNFKIGQEMTEKLNLKMHWLRLNLRMRVQCDDFHLFYLDN